MLSENSLGEQYESDCSEYLPSEITDDEQPETTKKVKGQTIETGSLFPFLREPEESMYQEERSINSSDDIHQANEISGELEFNSPLETFRLFLTNEVLELITKATNDYGQDKYPSKWIETTEQEIETTLMIVLWMGIFRLPTIKMYWQKDQLLLNNSLSCYITRDRFRMLLSNMHFSLSSYEPKNPKLVKIEEFNQLLIREYQKYVTPGSTVVIDESLVPFSGRLSFKQYMPGKSSKFGIKIFKLTTAEGFCLKNLIYTGKSTLSENDKLKTTELVMYLMEGYLDKGRVLSCDNYFTTGQIAQSLLERNTKIIGTLRKNRTCVSSSIKGIVVVRGNFIEEDYIPEIKICKYMDKKEVYFIDSTTDEYKRNFFEDKLEKFNENKPLFLNYYNLTKVGIDLGDQITSYNTSLRKTIKWYRKLAYDLLFNTGILNAFLIWKNTNLNSKMTITDFKLNLLDEFFKLHETKRNSAINHKLLKNEDRKKRNCKSCYKRLRKDLSRDEARNKMKKTISYCEKCGIENNMCGICYIKHIDKK